MANTVVPFVGGAFVRGFDTRARIRKVRVALLVIHGAADEVVPTKQGEAVFAAAHEPKTLWLVQEAGHNDLLEQAGDEYVVRLSRLYAEVRSGN